MLKETVGYTTFKIVDKKSGKYFYINNEDFLTPFQEKQMSFQPDFILEFAHHLVPVWLLKHTSFPYQIEAQGF